MKGSGQLRLTTGRKLISPPNLTARPTTSRVREALMNILSDRLLGSRWLDLCCGSGIMGCEAIERGANSVTAVDQDYRCAKTAQQNLETISNSQKHRVEIEVIRTDCFNWLKKNSSKYQFDIIYFDPPYERKLYSKILPLLTDNSWLSPGGLLICEYRSTSSIAIPEPWTQQDQRHYGSSSLLMLSLPERCHPDDIDSKQQQTIREE